MSCCVSWRVPGVMYACVATRAVATSAPARTTSGRWRRWRNLEKRPGDRRGARAAAVFGGDGLGRGRRRGRRAGVVRTAVEGHAFHVFSRSAACGKASNSNIPASGASRFGSRHLEKRLHHLRALHLYGTGTVGAWPPAVRAPCAAVVRKSWIVRVSAATCRTCTKAACGTRRRRRPLRCSVAVSPGRHVMLHAAQRPTDGRFARSAGFGFFRRGRFLLLLARERRARCKEGCK